MAFFVVVIVVIISQCRTNCNRVRQNFLKNLKLFVLPCEKYRIGEGNDPTPIYHIRPENALQDEFFSSEGVCLSEARKPPQTKNLAVPTGFFTPNIYVDERIVDSDTTSVRKKCFGVGSNLLRRNTTYFDIGSHSI